MMATGGNEEQGTRALNRPTLGSIGAAFKLPGNRPSRRAAADLWLLSSRGEIHRKSPITASNL